LESETPVLTPNSILGFFLRETGAKGALILAVVLACGGLHGALIGMMAFAIGNVTEHVTVGFATLTIVAGLVYLVADHYAFRRATELSERAIGRVTLRLLRRTRSLELLDLERIGPTRLTDLLARDLAAVSVLQRDVFAAASNLMVVVVLVVILLWTAPLVAIGLVAVWILMVRSSETNRIVRQEERAADLEGRFLALTRAGVEGFRELKLDAAKRADLFARGLRPLALATMGPRVTARSLTYRLDAILLTAVYLVAALAAFGADALGLGTSALAATFISLTLTYTMSDAVFAVANLAAGSYAVRNLRELEAEIAGAERPARAATARALPDAFASLRLLAGRFTYPDTGNDRPARIGPIDLELRAGSITFLAGGNGSGKSTLLKLITGLYPLSGGRLLLDGRDVDGPTIRGLFASVFTDFHLFSRLYGTDAVDESRASELLQRLGLAGKTRLVDGAFTTTNLSTGQRKRLALAVAVLEDRQIYAFDEWAADQDPEFRAYFYTELLPAMRDAGKTIIAATHDDRYFGICDQLIAMAGGKIVSRRQAAA
jgi:putative ATP-binding cassette transporter